MLAGTLMCSMYWRDKMKAVFVSIALCVAASAAHSMPLSLFNANKAQAIITIADQCGDRCESFRSNLGYRRALRGRYVLVRDPLIQRRLSCAFGSYVACIGAGTVCVDLCY